MYYNNWDNVATTTIPIQISSNFSSNLTYNDIIIEKENTNTNMNNKEFGLVTTKNIRLSPYGIAVSSNLKNWFTYKNKEIVDVTNFTYDVSNIFYKIPVTIKDIKENDIIFYNETPVFVLYKTSDNQISIVDVTIGEKKTIIPNTNPFGYSYITKLTSLINPEKLSPSAEKPFDELAPLFFLSQNNNNSNLNNLLLFSLLKENPSFLSNLTL